MIDLSNLLPGDPISALVPTGQTQTSTVTDNANARTAPGSEPAAPNLDSHPAPVVEAQQHSETVVTSGNEPSNSTQFTEDAGAGWMRSSGVSTSVNRSGPEGTRQAMLNSNPNRRP
jgi:hypothetical protein